MDSNLRLYQLYAIVAMVSDTEDQHLLACVNPDQDKPEEWIVFNDFTLTYVSMDDAVSVDVDWKLPCLLFYCTVDLSQRRNVEGRFV